MFLDTSTLIEIFTQDKESVSYSRIIQNISGEEIFVSQIQLGEVADWCVRYRIPVMERLTAIRKFAQIVPLDDEIFERAALIKRARRKAGHSDFGLLDGIILASARAIGQRLLTFDFHYQGEKDCIVLGESG
jgi:predicted nucleic acid-binding protein